MLRTFHVFTYTRLLSQDDPRPLHKLRLLTATHKAAFPIQPTKSWQSRNMLAQRYKTHVIVYVCSNYWHCDDITVWLLVIGFLPLIEPCHVGIPVNREQVHWETTQNHGIFRNGLSTIGLTNRYLIVEWRGKLLSRSKLIYLIVLVTSSWELGNVCSKRRK